MKKFEEDKILIKMEDGSEKVLYKMITFKSTKKNKIYLIYTDDQESDNIYSSILISNEKEIKLEKLAEEDDLEEVKKALIKAKVSLNVIQSMSGEII